MTTERRDTLILLASLTLALGACKGADEDGEASGSGSGSESSTTDDPGTGTDTGTDTDTGTETGTDTEPDPGMLEGELFCDQGSTPVGDWTRHVIADDILGPAFLAIADFDGDTKQDLVSSAFGLFTVDGPNITLSPGQVHVHLQRDGLDCWERVEVAGVDDGIYFPNETEVADIDADGDLDIVLASGFFVCAFDPSAGACGGLYVFENVGDSFVRHDIVHKGTAFYHRPALVDLNGDGVLDLLTGRETNQGGELIWYAGDPASDNFFAADPFVIDDETGTIPDFADIDGDGDIDVAAARFFGVDDMSAPYMWWEQVTAPSDSEPAGVWTPHVISADHGAGIMLRLSDALYGDGVMRAIVSNHVNQGNMSPDPWESAIIVFEPGDDPTQPWASTIISEGIVSVPDAGLSIADAPGVFGLGDAEGDDDLDVFLSGDGDPRTFWLEQTSPGVFTTHVIEDSLAQAGGGLVVDLDGDGDTDPVFTGYEDTAIYVYER